MVTEANALMMHVLAEEFRTHLVALRELMSAIEDDPTRIGLLRDARQRAHTIAASASVLGEELLVHAGQAAEQAFDYLVSDPNDPAVLVTLSVGLDDLAFLVQAMSEGQSASPIVQQRGSDAVERLRLAKPVVQLPSIDSVPPASADVWTSPEETKLVDPVIEGSRLDTTPVVDESLERSEARSTSGTVLRTHIGRMIATARDQVAILLVSPEDKRATYDLCVALETIAGTAGLLRLSALARTATDLFHTTSEVVGDPEALMAMLDDLGRSLSDFELTPAWWVESDHMAAMVPETNVVLPGPATSFTTKQHDVDGQIRLERIPEAASLSDDVDALRSPTFSTNHYLDWSESPKPAGYGEISVRSDAATPDDARDPDFGSDVSPPDPRSLSFDRVPSESEFTTVDLNELWKELDAVSVFDEESRSELASGEMPALTWPTTIRLSEEELDEEIRSVFADEAIDLLTRLDIGFNELERHPDNPDHLEEARRIVHTLKSAAASTRFGGIADLCHALENPLDRVADGRLPLTHHLLRVFFDCVEHLDLLVASVRSDESGLINDDTMTELKLRLLNTTDPIGSPVTDPELRPALELQVQSDASEADVSYSTTKKSAPTLLCPADDREAGDEALSGVVDAGHAIGIDSTRLEAMISLLGDVEVNRSALEQRLAHMRRVVRDLSTTTGKLRHLESSLGKTYQAHKLSRNFLNVDGEDRSLEMDRYAELHLVSRELTEAVADIDSIDRELQYLLGELSTVSAQQAGFTAKMRDRLLQVRLVKLESVLGRAYRIGRDLAQLQGKKVLIRTAGQDFEVDKTIVDGIAEALLHLVRNAIDHGIETPDVRAAAKKPETATLTCEAVREGNNVLIRIRDDGVGIDPEQVYERAIDRGLVSATTALTRQEKLDLIFMHGLSTRSEVSDISGRGVGLDIVKTIIQRMHGSVTVESAPGIGAAFVLQAPMTLAQ